MKELGKGISESEEPFLYRKIQAEGQEGWKGGDFKQARVVRAESDKGTSKRGAQEEQEEEYGARHRSPIEDLDNYRVSGKSLEH